MTDTTALVPVQSPGALMYRQSTDAASLCRAIVMATARMIQGKKYPPVEAWQAIATAHGCTVHIESVDHNGYGWEAWAKVKRDHDGSEISRACGMVGDDEPPWDKRTVHARHAMAQTRAMSRACRTAFAHVVVMISADLCTTPAEEMVDTSTGEVTPAPPKPRQNTPQKPAAATESAPSTSAGASTRRALFGRLREVDLDYKRDRELVLGIVSKMSGTTVTTLAEGKCELSHDKLKAFVDWFCDAPEEDINNIIKQLTAPKTNVVYPDDEEVEDPFAEMKGSAPSGANPGHGH